MAKVLHINIQGIQEDNNPDNALVATSVKVMQTGQSCISDGPTIELAVKALGLYKLPAVLNSEVVSGVEDYIDSEYSVSGFDRVYVTGGFTL